MIRTELVLHKANVTLGEKSYVVFGPKDDFPTKDDQHRPRPKLTIDGETWADINHAVAITIEVDEAAEVFAVTAP